MKIKEYATDFNVNECFKEIDKNMHLLMRGMSLPAACLNYILKYLGYDDEEVICMRDCSECPYSLYSSGAPCNVSSSNYVRNLISKKRNSLEDML